MQGKCCLSFSSPPSISLFSLFKQESWSFLSICQMNSPETDCISCLVTSHDTATIITVISAFALVAIMGAALIITVRHRRRRQPAGQQQDHEDEEKQVVTTTTKQVPYHPPTPLPVIVQKLPRTPLPDSEHHIMRRALHKCMAMQQLSYNRHRLLHRVRSPVTTYYNHHHYHHGFKRRTNWQIAWWMVSRKKVHALPSENNDDDIVMVKP